MAQKPRVQLTVDQQNLVSVARRIHREDEERGVLREKLMIELKGAAEPGVAAVKGALIAMPHRSSATPKPALGQYLAGKTSARVKLSGDMAGVHVVIRQSPRVRKFRYAARWLDRKSWRHPVFGSQTYVTQFSPMPGYIEEILGKKREAYRDAVMEVLGKMAHRIIRGRFDITE